jgi:hypothetical protein
VLLCAILLVQFADSATPHPDTLRATIDVTRRLEAFYAEQSYGQLTLNCEVAGPYLVAKPTATEPSIIRKELQASAIAASGTSANHIAVISPVINIGAGGYGDNSGVWIQSSTPDVRAPGFHILAHEFGHHLEQWNHDRGMNCSTGPLSGTCTTYNQGDSLSVMGYGNGHVSPLAKIKAGWLSATEITRTGDYTLAPYHQSGDVLKLTGGTKRRPTVYLLSYRPADAASSWVDPNNLQHGVVLYLITSESYLLAMNPTTGLPHTNTRPALMIGQSFCEGAFTVRPKGITSDGLVVAIDLRRCR